MGGGGEIGGKADGFQYLWKRVTSDATLNADARFIGTGSTDRGQAALMIRQSLDPDAAYAAALIYGDGRSAAGSTESIKVRPPDLPSSPPTPIMASIVHLSIWAGAATSPYNRCRQIPAGRSLAARRSW